VVALAEPVGLARSQEPVDLRVGFRADQTSDLRREVRVARLDAADGVLHEVPSQVYGEVRQGDELRCHLVFLADAPAQGRAHYLVFYGNPYAELPDYPTDLTVSGEGFGLDVGNQHYLARLSRQMGQLERLTYKRAHGLELFAGGEGHGEPPNIDWAHDYLASNNFQKFRVTNWATCPNYEVVRGPLCVQVRRWGFPHSPVHPLFTPSRMHITVTYTFYAGQPYFLKEGRMDVVKDFGIGYLRDDEWVFSGYAFTDTVWMDRDGVLHEGAAPAEQQDDLWGVGFFNRQSRDAFIALWLEHRAEGPGDKGVSPYRIYHCGAPTLNYQGHGQLWSRWAARNNPQFKAGASLHQRNAYLVAPYPEQGGPERVQELRQRLLNPLIASEGELPENVTGAVGNGRRAVPNGRRAVPNGLARSGETEDTAPLKRAVWSALREVRDEMFYEVDANVVDMGYIYDVRVRGETVTVLMTMPHRGRPKYGFIGNPIRERLLRLDGVREVVVDFTWEPAWTAARLTDAGRKAMGLN
jgi:metal-sulfur cluster biosynthetic enzyme